MATRQELEANGFNNMGTTDIAKAVRKQLKNEFPGCKFSVTTEYYAGGSSISMSCMVADRKLVKDISEISEAAFDKQEFRNGYSKEAIAKMQKQGEHQLNNYTLRLEYEEDVWCNGVFLTEEGHKLMQRAEAIVNQYNYDESDAMSDYFSVNFYLHTSLGKWDKPFIDGGQNGSN